LHYPEKKVFERKRIFF